MANIFINPLDDEGFKVLFGPKIGRNNMLNFLRALLPELGIVEIEYLDTEQMGLSPEEGKSVFDLSVLTGDGSRVIIEMQKTNLRFFNYRSVYYTSHAVQVQAARERERQRNELAARHCEPFWNYWFPPVYFIGILVNGMGGPSSESEASSGCVRQFCLREKNTGEDMGVELKNISGLEGMPEDFGDSEEMAELFERSLLANLPIDTVHEIEVHRNMTTKNDILVALAEAREEALAEGEARGEARGEVKGEAKGEVKGRVEVARAMLEKNTPVDFIASVTGLTEEQVRNL